MALADLALLAVLIYAFGMACGMWLMGWYLTSCNAILRENRIERDPRD
jgi:hypothetical protein